MALTSSYCSHTCTRGDTHTAWLTHWQTMHFYAFDPNFTKLFRKKWAKNASWRCNQFWKFYIKCSILFQSTRTLFLPFLSLRFLHLLNCATKFIIIYTHLAPKCLSIHLFVGNDANKHFIFGTKRTHNLQLRTENIHTRKHKEQQAATI